MPRPFAGRMRTLQRHRVRLSVEHRGGGSPDVFCDHSEAADTLGRWTSTGYSVTEQSALTPSPWTVMAQGNSRWHLVLRFPSALTDQSRTVLWESVRNISADLAAVVV